MAIEHHSNIQYSKSFSVYSNHFQRKPLSSEFQVKPIDKEDITNIIERLENENIKVNKKDSLISNGRKEIPLEISIYGKDVSLINKMNSINNYLLKTCDNLFINVSPKSRIEMRINNRILESNIYNLDSVVRLGIEGEIYFDSENKKIERNIVNNVEKIFKDYYSEKLNNILKFYPYQGGKLILDDGIIKKKEIYYQSWKDFKIILK